MCLAAIAAPAQQKAELIVSYESKSKNWETDSIHTTRMTLLANAEEAKYFNDISLWTDSLKSTPEGKEQWQQIIMAACMTQTPDGGISLDFTKGPVKKVHTYVFTNLAKENVRLYDEFAGEPYYYDEAFAEMEWSMADSTTHILGYECMMATTDYHGRKWTAWFAPEIPAHFGPWKLRGLPGLILKAEADNGNGYTATGIENSDRLITPMYSSDTYEKTDRKKALAEEEYYMNNRESIIQAKHGGSVKFQYDPSARPKYDASKYANEPDYK